MCVCGGGAGGRGLVWCGPWCGVGVAPGVVRVWPLVWCWCGPWCGVGVAPGVVRVWPLVWCGCTAVKAGAAGWAGVSLGGGAAAPGHVLTGLQDLAARAGARGWWQAGVVPSPGGDRCEVGSAGATQHTAGPRRGQQVERA
mgnify:CR=1 FL=1